MAAADHDRLLQVLVGLPCHVAVSSYWSQQYATALAGWSSDRRQVQTRWGGPRWEWLWFNFQADTGEQYRGGDYRQRWRVEKKRRRWRRNFQALPLWEQRVLLAEIIDAHAQAIDQPR